MTKRIAKGGKPAESFVEFNQLDTVADKDFKAMNADERQTLAEANFRALGLADLTGEPQTVKVANCYHEINQREQTQLEGNAARLAESMKRRGYDPACPIVVSAKAKGRLLILRGHSRHLAATQCGITEIPAIVYSGLSAAQERLLVADETADGQSLAKSDWAQFLEIAEIVYAGYASETALAVHFGWYTTDKVGAKIPARNKMQLRVNAAKMARRIPRFFAALQNGLAATVDTARPYVKWNEVQALRKGDNADVAKGVTDGTGAEFGEAWDAIQARHNSGETSAKAALTPSAATKTVETLSSAILRDTLLAATGQGAEGVTLSGLDAQCVAAEVALSLITRLREFDSARFDSFVAEMESATATEPATV